MLFPEHRQLIFHKHSPTTPCISPFINLLAQELIGERPIPAADGGSNATAMAGKDELFMQLKIIRINENEPGGFFEAEAGMDGTMEPIFCVDDTGDAYREDEEGEGSGEKHARRWWVWRGRTEEEKVKASDDGEEIEEEEYEGVAANGVSGEWVERRLPENWY